jgi:hypothetical protein
MECRLRDGDKLFFLHIHKTAGTSLTRFLEDHFDRDRISPFYYVEGPGLNELSRAGYFDYLRGHIPYDLIAQVLDTPPFCVTILRNPTERFLSHFAQMRRNHAKSRRPRQPFDLRNMELSELVQDSELVASTLGLNVQVFLVGGKLDLQKGKALRAGEGNQWRRGDGDALELARRRLDEFAFVGLSERFQESLFLLCYTFGWQPPLYLPRLNAALDRLRREDLSAQALDRIAEFNALDFKLYEHGKRVFEARYAQMTDGLLESYGDAAQAALPRPLPHEVVCELLERHYEQGLAESHQPTQKLRVDFDQALPGRGWHQRETWPWPERDTVRWTGPGTVSTLDLALAGGHDLRIRCRVAGAAAPDILPSLRLTANNELVRLYQRRPSRAGVVLEGWIPRRALEKRKGFTRLAFAVNRTARAGGADGGGDEQRQLGLAFSWFEILPGKEPSALFFGFMALLGVLVRLYAAVATDARIRTRLRRVLRPRPAGMRRPQR